MSSASEAKPAAPFERRKPTVLIVDDSPDNLQLLNEILAGHFLVRVARDGAQALKAALQKPKPDVILLDVMMPEMDGYEVCRHLKSRAITAEIPVIFVTAKNTIEDAQLGFDVGAADYITKPILPPVVLARVKTHASLKLARDYFDARSGM